MAGSRAGRPKGTKEILGWMDGACVQLAVDDANFESENIGGAVEAAGRGHRIETNSRGHCNCSNHRRASVKEQANGIAEYGNELADREP